jgi:hypothetical protein
LRAEVGSTERVALIIDYLRPENAVVPGSRELLSL